MQSKRPGGIALLAFYYFFWATFLLGSAAVAYEQTGWWAAHSAFLAQFAQVPQNPQIGPLIAALWGAYCVTMGAGFWLLKRWARVIVLVNTYYFFGRGIVLLLAFAWIWPAEARPIVSSPWFPIVLVMRLILWWYLVDDRTKEAFGIPPTETA